MTAPRSHHTAAVGELARYRPPVPAPHHAQRTGTAGSVIVRLAVACSLGMVVIGGRFERRLKRRGWRRSRRHPMATPASTATRARRPRVVAETTGAEYLPVMESLGFDAAGGGERQSGPFDQRSAP